MSKKCYRFFGGLLNAQANWLNQMSQKGYRLVRTGRMLYEWTFWNALPPATGRTLRPDRTA